VTRPEIVIGTIDEHFKLDMHRQHRSVLSFRELVDLMSTGAYYLVGNASLTWWAHADEHRSFALQPSLRKWFHPKPAINGSGQLAAELSGEENPS
jgi:hypothetical protein